jgi:TatD DNase family protein
MLIDTHCHIHEPDYPISFDEVNSNSTKAGVEKMICVGTSVESSRLAIDFANKYDNTYAAIGVHPHDAKDGCGDIRKLLSNNSSVVAVGEIGLDYYYEYSPRDVQKAVLRQQIQMAIGKDLPIIFHVREAFDDFWPIFDSYVSNGQRIRGVMHCFTDNAENAKKCLERGLYIGVGGFSTFVKDEEQKNIFKDIPLAKVLLETDAPFLTPVPFRGKINQPAFVREIAVYLANLRRVSLEEISVATTANARSLFNI